MQMNKQLRILHLEDEQLDIELIHETLSNDGIDHIIINVESESEFINALENNPVDLILADYKLPNFDGISALEIARNQFRDIPFIFVSGALGEEAAVATIKKGATDYVLKQRLHHLAPAIRRALAESEERQKRLTAEAALKQSENLLQNIFNSIQDGIMVIDTNFNIIRVNPGLEKCFPNKKPLEKRKCYETIYGMHTICHNCPTNRAIESKSLVMDERSLEMKDGSVVWVEIYSYPLINDNGTITGAVEHIRRITKRKQSQEALKAERDKLQGVLSVIGDGLYIINTDFTIEYQNGVLEASFGNCTGKKCYEVYFNSKNICNFCPAIKTIASRKLLYAEADLADGRSYDVCSSPFTDTDGDTKTIVLLRDITEHKTLQAEAMHAGHLASLGELSAGLAHEINNPINGVINYAEILKDEFEEEDRDIAIPERIIKEGERIAKIVANLLSFARDKQDDYAYVHIKDIIEDTFSLVETQIMKDAIMLTVDIPLDFPAVIARNQEIQQVFLNLLSNSRHALNQKFPSSHEDKSIEITGEKIVIEGHEYVRTIFHDSGTGISPDIMDKICNPFFSTKPKGEGTGLGLSISHGIINNHGGRLWFESIEGEYTNVIVDLPISNEF